MKRISTLLIAGSTFVIGVAVLSGLLWLALAHAQWSSSRTSSGLVNAGSLAGPGVITVDIDVKPGSDPNSTNLGSRGVIPVAILTTDTFDATTVDPTTVDFAGAPALRSALEDVDEDGDVDLIMHFRTQDADIPDHATEACLTGQTTSGEDIEGSDIIRIVPPEADADRDGFGDAVEATVTTDQFAACGENAWPPDINDDQSVNILDVGQMVPAWRATLGEANYDSRLDLNADGAVNIADVGKMAPFWRDTCT